MKKIKAWFISLINGTRKLLKKYLPIAVYVTQGIKKAIESGTVDFLADIVKRLIQGGADDILIDKAVSFAKKRIPELCLQLEIINIAHANSPDAVGIALDTLKETYGEKWEEFMKGIAGELVEYLSDGKIDLKEAKELASSYYKEYVK